MRCEKCGREMAPGYFACIYCGSPFYPGEPLPGKKENRRKLILLITAVVTVLLLAAVVLCVIFFRA